MTRLRFRFAAVASVWFLVGAAFAQDDVAPGAGWYVSGSGSVVFPNDSVLEGTGLSVDFSPGVAARVAGGITLMPPEAPLDFGLSLELEYVFRYADIDTITLGGVGALGVGGDVIANSVMANFIAEIQIGDTGLGLYGGGGVGVGIADATLTVAGLGSVSDNDTAFAWQVLGGIKYHIDSHWMVYTGVRYWSLDDLNFSGIGTDLSTVEWEFGFRYYF